ncbi:hypothetical protein pEaSNUABM5_00303 [Erwinia phage pEa_SNUABM_5]|uniref:Uncharacterized protein n=1 Tax=Erwinia phage pEa_SNUABM_5 TaxID=2797313 RepID=A0A7T8EPT9_9CAUD|nr:hypothetical protein MPK73_gp303 [Erwinia phage pEa_SNUABM_5]QQO90445.1 hypothetical protein pEaSNUABM5_00303 [Erwinia phage pEa_SNUABM_5]
MQAKLKQQIKHKAHAASGTHVVYQDEIHQFDSLITTLRLAVETNPNINNKKFARVVRDLINNNQYGTSEEVLAVLVVLYKSSNPLRDFAKLSEDALLSRDDDKQIMVDID